jgi:hypothetical protein
MGDAADAVRISRFGDHVLLVTARAVNIFK